MSRWPHSRQLTTITSSERSLGIVSNSLNSRSSFVQLIATSMSLGLRWQSRPFCMDPSLCSLIDQANLSMTFSTLKSLCHMLISTQPVNSQQILVPQTLRTMFILQTGQLDTSPLLSGPRASSVLVISSSEKASSIFHSVSGRWLRYLIISYAIIACSSSVISMQSSFHSSTVISGRSFIW